MKLIVRNILVFPLALLVRVPATLLSRLFLFLGRKLASLARAIPAVEIKG
jgi:hypothetical protein